MNIKRAATALSIAIQCPTISSEHPSEEEMLQFAALHSVLEKHFPVVHEHLDVQNIAGGSLLMKWPAASGGKCGAKARPLLPVALMAHSDVVPAADGVWEHPPFSGAIAQGYVWGRGAIDQKFGLICILEAVESLLEQGFAPSRDIYIISTHDEETGAKAGISAVRETLERLGVVFEFVLDEGGAVTQALVPSLSAPVALLGVAEKGFVDVGLTVCMDSGHSSSPGRVTAIGLLCNAVASVEANQMPARLTPPVVELIRALARHLGWTARIAMPLVDVLSPLVARQLLSTPHSAALVRSTTAPTIITGGVRRNVLASRASAVVNFRTLPGDEPDDIIEHVKSVVNDERVDVTLLVGSSASRMSSVTSRGFAQIKEAVQNAFPECIVAPYLVTGGTDSKYLEPLAKDVYRFTPALLGKADLAAIHSSNERVSIENISRAVSFYRKVITIV